MVNQPLHHVVLDVIVYSCVLNRPFHHQSWFCWFFPDVWWMVRRSRAFATLNAPVIQLLWMLAPAVSCPFKGPRYYIVDLLICAAWIVIRLFLVSPCNQPSDCAICLEVACTILLPIGVERLWYANALPVMVGILIVGSLPSWTVSIPVPDGIASTLWNNVALQPVQAEPPNAERFIRPQPSRSSCFLNFPIVQKALLGWLKLVRPFSWKRRLLDSGWISFSIYLIVSNLVET